jgi:hypothetical protein
MGYIRNFQKNAKENNRLIGESSLNLVALDVDE